MSVFVKQKGTTLDTFQIGKSGVTLDASGVSNKTLTVPDKNGTIATLDDVSSKLNTLQSINAQTGTTYTLALADLSKLVTLNNGSAITLEVPTNTSIAFSVGSTIDIVGIGAGAVTITPASGVTVNGTPGLKLRAKYSAATLVKIDTDTWLAIGDLSA